jgi:hypothetical protein
MTIKVVVLQSKEQIVTEIKEVISGDNPVAYLFTNPQLVELNRFGFSEDKDTKTSIEVTLSPWILASDEKEIPVPINQVVTIVKPLESIEKMYLEKTNGQSNQTDSVDQQGDLVE